MNDLRLPALVASVPHYAGLGNRIRFLLSCQAIADAEGRRFYYHWPTGERGAIRFGARLDELWNYSSGSHIDNLESIPKPLKLSGSVDDLGSVRDDEIIHVIGDQTVAGFGGEVFWGDLLAHMKPTEQVMRLVEGAVADLGAEYISVQVRAHPSLTHAKTLEHSPVSWYVSRVLSMRDRNPDVQFFLSSDTEEAQAEISAQVPGVQRIPSSGDYNSREALIKSTADLVMLSRSSHILAPYWSSFAQLGWIMGRKTMPLEDSQRFQK